METKAETTKVSSSKLARALLKVVPDLGKAHALTELRVLSPGERSAPRGARVCGFVGMTGETLRGSVILDISLRTLGQSYPAQGEGAPLPSEADLIDWCGELTNQLVGRIKSVVSREGMNFFLSAPAVVLGNSMQVFQNQRVSGEAFLFACGDDLVQLWLQAEDLVVEAEVAPESQAVETHSEGSLMMF